jgi:hypothetical protein
MLLSTEEHGLSEYFHTKKQADVRSKISGTGFPNPFTDDMSVNDL